MACYYYLEEEEVAVEDEVCVLNNKLNAVVTSTFLVLGTILLILKNADAAIATLKSINPRKNPCNSSNNHDKCTPT